MNRCRSDALWRVWCVKTGVKTDAKRGFVFTNGENRTPIEQLLRPSSSRVQVSERLRRLDSGSVFTVRENGRAVFTQKRGCFHVKNRASA